jgi:predicted  nucleic acid-binding Zn-ribbon protein
LDDNSEVEMVTNQDRGEIARIENEIERLQSEYDNDTEVRTDLLDEISDLEDELTELQTKIDVYNIIPVGTHYDTTTFEVIDSSVEGQRYAVGTESEMKTSAYDYVDQLIDDIGYRGFTESFAMDYIDYKAVLETAEEIFDQDVRDNPDVYLSDEDRMLSDDQEEKIKFLLNRITQAESMIDKFEYEMDGENDDDIQEKIDEMNEKIEEMNDEITEIKDDPEGDWPDELIDDAIQDRLRDVNNNIVSFMEEFGLEWDNYMDKDAFIEGVIDSDGYGNTLNTYDGNADEVRIQDEWYYVMRLD